MVEEKVGRQYADNMTPAQASRLRSERIEGKRLSRKQLIEDKKNKVWTVNLLWDEYKNSNSSVKGLIQDESRFKNFISPNFGSKQPSEISSIEIERFRTHLLKSKKPATVRNILELLRRIIKYGERNQLCETFDRIIQMPKVDNIRTEDLNPEQLDSLLTVIESDQNIQVANFMKMVLFTGMRRSELFRLKWEEINFKSGFINIRNPKGGSDQRIPMNDAARHLLLNHPRTDSEYVFPGRNGKQRVDITKQVNRIKKQAKLPDDFRPLHGLRHVYASMLASSGQVDMYTLQKLLTHKSPQMTQRYAHLRDETLKRAADLAGDLINSALKTGEKDL
ncbi:tyrosine-type recombinase/integrase [Candidatus Latescibacterota bacterium]